MKPGLVNELGRDEAQPAHRLEACGDAKECGAAAAVEAFARREHGRHDDRSAVHRAALEGVVEILAVGRGAVDHRRVLGAKSACVPDGGARAAAVHARDKRPNVL